MGRLPLLYVGKPIIDREPYHMDGQLTIAAQQPELSFDLAQFEHTNDKPFEVHRMIFRFYALGNPVVTVPSRSNQKLVLGGKPVQPQPSFMEHVVKINVSQESRAGQKITKEPTRGLVLSKKDTKTWEWEEPFTLARGDIFGVSARSDSMTFAPFSTNLSMFSGVVTQILVSVCFQGFLVIVSAPQERSAGAPAELGMASLKRSSRQGLAGAMRRATTRKVNGHKK